MKKKLILKLSVIVIISGVTGVVTAAGDMTAKTPIEINVQLGDSDNTLRFFPSHLEFETGKLYKLVLSNPSEMSHYFSSEGLARSVFTRKVQVLSSQGKKISEIKGVIRELEIYPGGTAEWWFVPVKTARLDDLKCIIKDHAKAGMVGTIVIH